MKMIFSNFFSYCATNTFSSYELTRKGKMSSAFIISIIFGNDNDRILDCDGGSETDFAYYGAD